MNAHGKFDLRRKPLAIPPSLSVFSVGQASTFRFSDAHLHMDQLLLSRRHGSCFFYKRDMCKYRTCRRTGCAWAHGPEDRRPPFILERTDLEELAAEIKSVPGSTFGGCVHSCCEIHSIELSLQIVQWGREVLDGRVYSAFGIHPSEYLHYGPKMQEEMEAALDACGAQGVAWGECGLDYYRAWADLPQYRECMCECFAAQARVAVRRKLPLIVHTRDAEEDTLNILRANVPSEHRVYLHSFMGTQKFLEDFLEGWPHGYIGICGAISYPAAEDLRERAKFIPLKRLLLETDGPHMAPEPHRGEESHPGHIPWIAVAVAKAKGISVLEVIDACHANFLNFYGL